eukprot:gnl/TRDRNA2_/TRDRNA2_71274_c0_seq1.p1 gnl/TRDRNA2_/TRDRNA2_71274_c0~~gnl/TRDRNA2_/TRDRNA2_71274_c0_seq1.p1  ORF type:complete len:109 (+),score=1.72 gnl/TRDRNA2_/TRDRNA2_71274_c0_seq1:462-788(+)
MCILAGFDEEVNDDSSYKKGLWTEEPRSRQIDSEKGPQSALRTRLDNHDVDVEPAFEQFNDATYIEIPLPLEACHACTCLKRLKVLRQPWRWCYIRIYIFICISVHSN